MRNLAVPWSARDPRILPALSSVKADTSPRSAELSLRATADAASEHRLVAAEFTCSTDSSESHAGELITYSVVTPRRSTRAAARATRPWDFAYSANARM